MEEAYRDNESNGYLTDNPSGNYVDPSTRKVTVVYYWPQSATNTLSKYITRSGNQSFIQKDWSLGGGDSGVYSSTGTVASYFDSSGINSTSSAGVLLIDL